MPSPSPRTRLWQLGFGIVLAGCSCVVWANPGTEAASSLRRPIALVLSADEQHLYVANRQSGTLSVVALHQPASVAGEVAIGRRLSDLRAVGDGSLLLATDEDQHELLLLRADGSDVAVRQRLPVAQYPVSVAVSRDGRYCVVAYLWSRRLSFVEQPPDGQPAARLARHLDLPLAPRCLRFVRDDSRLIVADSFGGRLAIVDPAEAKLLHLREFPGHNIRGLGVSVDGKMLIVAHQMLNELAHTVENDVHWGLLMSNDLRWLKLDGVLSPDADLYDGAHMHPLGHAGSATGDPSGLVVTTPGDVVVSLGGVGEIALGGEQDFSLHRLTVGRRPTAMIADQQGERVFVANTFDDSISVVDLPKYESSLLVSLGPQRPLELVEHGELLFYDASLSHDNWMSCHSCHTDGHTNNLLNDNFSDASFGAPKRVLSLLSSHETAPFAWNGSAESLEAQIQKSLTETMQIEEDAGPQKIAALAAYVESLQPPPSIDVARDTRDDQALARGQILFETLGCIHCHQPPVYTTPETYDVGLTDKFGNRQFNPPSLRGVGQRGPYFHDNSAASLEAILQERKHQLTSDLPDGDLRDLLAFLRSL